MRNTLFSGKRIVLPEKSAPSTPVKAQAHSDLEISFIRMMTPRSSYFATVGRKYASPIEPTDVDRR